jgi:hypothetical protein
LLSGAAKASTPAEMIVARFAAARSSVATQVVRVDQFLPGPARRAIRRLACRSSRHLLRTSGQRHARRSPADHRNPVTACHLAGGEPEQVLNDQVRFVTGRRNAVSFVAGVVSAGVAA